MTRRIAPATIAATAKTGNRRATLEAMRDKLARDMDEAPANVVAQIAGRLSAVLEEIDSLVNPKARSTLDELEAKRASRLSTSGVSDPARKPTRQSRSRSG